MAAIITGPQLGKHLRAGTGTDPAELDQVAAAADELVTQACRKPLPEPTPATLTEAALAVGAELWKAREAIGGAYQLADFTTVSGYRLSSNLMRRVDALLAGVADTKGMVG